MAFAVVLLGFTAATQDIVIDAYRIESAGAELQALMSSSYIAGYRIGMLTSGAGSLVLASWLGSTSEAYSYAAWQSTYAIMALTMLVGAVTTLIIREPENHRPSNSQYTSRQYLKFPDSVCGGHSRLCDCLHIYRRLRRSLPPDTH